MNASDLNYEELTGWLPLFLQAWGAERMRTVLPGRVERYADGRAVVLPLLDVVRRDGTHVSRPLVGDVPVLMPGCMSWGVSLPLQAGDLVLLLWSQRGLDSWKRAGMAGRAPGGELFASSGVLALPWHTAVQPVGDGEALLRSGDGRVVLRLDDDGVEIEVGSGQEIRLGGGDRLVTAGDLVSAFNAHTHTSPSGGGTTSAPVDGLTEDDVGTDKLLGG